MLIEKSRECHNHNPQQTPDTKRKRKRTEINACNINKQMHEKHTAACHNFIDSDFCHSYLHTPHDKKVNRKFSFLNVGF